MAGFTAIPESTAVVDRAHRALIHAQAVEVRYGGRLILGPLDFSVAAGEFVTVLGHSGAGKTTLLRMLGGMRGPDGGTLVRPDGLTGWMAQEHNIFPWMTVLRNAAFALEMAGVGQAERERQALAMLARMGLAGYEHAWPHHLSAGMKQRVALARVFLGNFSLLLMDEPFSALDTPRRRDLQSELLQLWDRTRVPVVFVTHDVEEAVFLSQRIVVLGGRPGAIQAEVRVDLPYPRTPGLALTDSFVRIERQVHALLGEHAG